MYNYKQLDINWREVSYFLNSLLQNWIMKNDTPDKMFNVFSSSLIKSAIST